MQLVAEEWQQACVGLGYQHAWVREGRHERGGQQGSVDVVPVADNSAAGLVAVLRSLRLLATSRAGLRDGSAAAALLLLV